MLLDLLFKYNAMFSTKILIVTATLLGHNEQTLTNLDFVIKKVKVKIYSYCYFFMKKYKISLDSNKKKLNLEQKSIILFSKKNANLSNSNILKVEFINCI